MTALQRVLAGSVLAVGLEVVLLLAGVRPRLPLALACGVLGGLVANFDVALRLIRSAR